MPEVSKYHADSLTYNLAAGSLLLFGVSGIFSAAGVSNLVKIFNVIILLTGLILISVSTTLHNNEKGDQPVKISQIIIQMKNREPDKINEPAILSGVASTLTAIGGFQMLRTYSKEKSFDWPGILLYSAGWIGNGFAASMSKSCLDSVDSGKLAWSLTGSTLITIGTVAIPFEASKNIFMGPAIPLSALGYTMFTLGSAKVYDQK